MKLSDISSQKLSPGRYLITASYDGDAVYNSAQAQLILTIDESGGAHIDIQPIDDGGAMQVIKVEPDISFNPSTLNIIEKNLEEYPFDWTSYLSNPKDVPYSLYTSTGLELDGYQRLCWNASGTYVLTLITTETDLYLSKTINLTLNITAKINPQIEYVNNNEQFTLENGNFTKRYINIEKREGVYMFDLLQPTNPYALPLKYKISDEKHGTIDVDDNKIYISEEGKYKITAYYEGDDTYRSSITYYILKYYEGEEPADDETEPAQRKQNPNLSFELSNVTQNKENDNLYKVLPLINPYSVSGGIWVVSKGSINYDGTTITYDGTGSIMVFYEFPGNDKYNAQTASYILNIKSEDNPDNLPLPDVGFDQMIVTVQENEPHEYQIQYAYNNSGVAINYYYNDELIENGILKTTDLGNLNIVGITENNGTFASTKIYYTLRIEKYEAQDPEISFDQPSTTEYQSNNYEYLLQFVNNPHEVELEWSSSKGVITDNVLYCEELGTIIITVKSKPSFYYLESTISYTLVIEETPKLSPELSFDDEAQFFNGNGTLQYSVQAVNNPHNVELRWFSDRGELNSEMNPTYLTISAYAGPINIYCKSVEDETYKSETVTYKLYVGATRQYLEYTKHEDYTIEKNQGTFDLEMLRYTKSQDLEFDPTEWTFTSSLQSYCTVKEKYYIEEDDYIVVMAKLKITKPCNPLISISFSGNDYFYNISNIRVHVNLVGKELLDPEISFSNSYEVADLTEDGKYLLQDVNNPHNVEIIYSASSGTVQDHILTYEGKFNVIVKATSVENDTYSSKTISYKLGFQEPQKPSSGIHFGQSTITVTQTNDGIYELQGLLDAEDNPIADTSTLGYYSANIFGDITYDENRGCWTIKNKLFNGNATIRFIIYETNTYRKETITYTLTILSNEKADPELSFDKYQINVNENNENRWPVQRLNNPHNVPVTWFCTKGEFDDPNNPQYITYDKREYISIGVQSQETETYASRKQSYGMSILLPSLKNPNLSFEKSSEGFTMNEEGIYPIQKIINPYNVSPITYTASSGEIIDGYLHRQGQGNITITATYPGDKEYESSLNRYTLSIVQNSKKYLHIETCGSVEIEGELNTDYEVNLVKWPITEEYEYNSEDWSIHSSNYRCKPSTIRTETINGYVYLIGTFQFSSDCYSSIGTEFKGNDGFYSSTGNSNSISITFSHPVEVDNRVVPSLSFNKYMYYVTQTTNYMYELQTLIKPDDVEIDYWEIDYGGRDVETAKIIDDAYVYYEGTDYIHLKVHTKASEKYKAASNGYSMYVNVKTKTGTSIIFASDRITKNKAVDGIYNVQSATTNPTNLALTWTSSTGELINNNTQLRYSSDGEVTITASFAGDDEYEASTSSYKLVISETMAKRYLQTSEYKSQDIEVVFGEYYNIPIIKWPISENLEYNQAEWYLSNSYSSKCVVDHLFTVDEGDYRILKAKCTFTTSGSTYLRIRFLGNDYFYGSSGYQGFYLAFHRDPNIVLIDPMISWPEEEQTFEQADNNKYLIQTPVSEYQDVEFDNPKVSRGVVVQENDNFYVQATGLNDIIVTIKNLSNNVYVSKTISYTIKLTEKQIIKEDSELSFANSVDNVEYIWQIGAPKYYKIQPLHNPYDIPVTFKVNKKLIGGNYKTYLENGYIDYNYYVEVDDIEDVVINCIGQENDYYYITSNPSYTMHIQRTGQIVDMYFAQSLVNYSLNSNGYHKLQEVVLSEEISDIRNNIVYNVDGNNATITKQNGVYYLVTNTPGNYTIRATYQGDGTYASTESSYEVTIVEVTKKDAPIYFSEDTIYTLEQESNIYPLQIPSCSDNSFDFDNILIWNLPSGWSLVGTNGITSSQPIEENTTLHIECSIPETEEYYGKTIQYDLIIQAKVYLSVTVHDNYENELKEFDVLEQEVLRWPVSQNVSYVESEWTLTCQTSPHKDAFYSSLTHHVVDGYHVLYIYYLATFYGTITVNLNYSGNSNVHSGQYGLYIRLKQYVKPESEKDDPEICWTQGDYIEVDSNNNQNYNRPQITNPHGVGYNIYYQQARPKVSGSTITDYTQLDLIGSKYLLTGSTISFQGEGYVVFSLISTSDSNYYSITDYIVMYIRKDPNAPVVPTQTPRFSISPINMSVDYNEENKYPLPTITNTDNVEYHIYSGGGSTEIFPENGYITLGGGWGKEYVNFITTSDDTFVSKKITVQYDVKNPRPKLSYTVKMGNGGSWMSGYLISGHIYREPNTYNCYVLDEINTPISDRFENMQFYIRWKTSDYDVSNANFQVIDDYRRAGGGAVIGGTYSIFTNTGFEIDIERADDTKGHPHSVEPLLCGGIYLYKEDGYTYLLPRLYLPDREKYEMGRGSGTVQEYKSNNWRADQDYYNITISFSANNFQRTSFTFEHVEFQRKNVIEYHYISNADPRGIVVPLKYTDTKYKQSNKLVNNLNNLNSITWKESKLDRALFYPY